MSMPDPNQFSKKLDIDIMPFVNGFVISDYSDYFPNRNYNP